MFFEITGWPVVGLIFGLLITLGVSLTLGGGVIVNLPYEFTVARLSFIFAFTILLIRSGYWLAFEQSKSSWFVLSVASFMIFGCIGFLWFFSMKWVSNRQEAAQKLVTPIEQPKQPTAEEIANELAKKLPSKKQITLPALDIFVDRNKILRLKNLGQVDISDIQVFMTIYKLKAHMDERNHFILDDGIDTFSTISSPIAKKAFLAKGGTEYEIELIKLFTGAPPFFVSFEEWVALEKEKQFDVDRTVYCLRILFRNDLTKQRQVYYLLTNAMKQHVDQWTTRDNAIGGGSGVEDYRKKYRDLIKKHQQSIYEDDTANFYSN